MVYRSFKISINFLIFVNIFHETSEFAIRNKFVLFLYSFWFTMISVLFGWWGGHPFRPFRTIRNTLTAIHVNTTGGIDKSKEINALDYDEKTNFVWNNLLRETCQKINIDVVEIIIEIHDEFAQNHEELFAEDNLSYIRSNLRKVGVHNVERADIEDVFDALQGYERLDSE